MKTLNTGLLLLTTGRRIDIPEVNDKIVQKHDESHVGPWVMREVGFSKDFENKDFLIRLVFSTKQYL